jgi:hypothetical protein
MVTLSVGEAKPVNLHIHKDILCASAKFFGSATKQEWKETHDHVIPLPKDEPDVVSTYIRWLYTGVLYTGESIETEVEWERLVLAYIFGDKIQDDDYKDATIDGLISKSSEEKLYPIHKTREIYENTVSGDLARRLWVHWFVYARKPEWMDEAKEDLYTKRFLFELAQALMWPKAMKPPYETGTCYYHIHGQRRCYKDRPFP